MDGIDGHKKGSHKYDGTIVHIILPAVSTAEGMSLTWRWMKRLQILSLIQMI